jgi:hypothetical protein
MIRSIVLCVMVIGTVMLIREFVDLDEYARRAAGDRLRVRA